MDASAVLSLAALLEQEGIFFCLQGGWGIDALCGCQTRAHKDMDVLVNLCCLGRFIDLMEVQGFVCKLIWEENAWIAAPSPLAMIACPGAPEKAASAFVLRNAAGNELDVHVIEMDAAGNGTPCWNTEEVFQAVDLQGKGTILGRPVRCMSAEMQMLCHTGYTLEEKDCNDMYLLNKRFGTALPAELQGQAVSGQCE